MTEPAGRTEGSRPRFVRGPERVVHQGHVFSVVVGEFVAPDGQRFSRDLLHHPGAVSIVPVDGDHVVMVRQYRPALDLHLLEIPAGLRDVDGEPPEHTARRELAEEAGLRADSLEYLGRLYNAPGMSDEEILLYLATGLHPTETAAQGPEEQHMQVERVRLDEVDSLIASGELLDAKTIIGVLLAKQRLGR